MLAPIKKILVPSFLALGLILYPAPATQAQDQDAAWTVSKSSGEVWLTSSGAQPVSLSASTAVNAGDMVRTGPNGRLLLTRGEEKILVSPNSEVGIPAEKKDGLSTTILQKAGSILLEVEKRGENHFQVETPYLAAVVKGTQFRVTVDKQGSRVEVLRGKVDVTDFKSGQHALVLPGQAAKVWSAGRSGLSLSGSGTLSPIEHGKPRAPSIEPASPKTTLSTASLTGTQAVRISAPLGEVNLDVKKVTKGMAHGNTAARLGRDKAAGGGNGGGADTTVWTSRDLAPGNGAGQGNGGGNSGGGNGGNAGNGGNSGSGSGNSGPGNNGIGNAIGHLVCNIKSKGKSGC